MLGSSSACSPPNLKRASAKTWRILENWLTHQHKATTPDKPHKPNHHRKTYGAPPSMRNQKQTSRHISWRCCAQNRAMKEIYGRQPE
eukprot:8481901-Pyramimonas_sp.AAC.1